MGQRNTRNLPQSCPSSPSTSAKRTVVPSPRDASSSRTTMPLKPRISLSSSQSPSLSTSSVLCLLSCCSFIPALFIPAPFHLLLPSPFSSSLLTQLLSSSLLFFICLQVLFMWPFGCLKEVV